MEDFFTRLDVTVSVKAQEAVVGFIHLPAGIGIITVVIQHPAPHHDQIVRRRIRAGEQIIIQPVFFLKVIMNCSYNDNGIFSSIELLITVILHC